MDPQTLNRYAARANVVKALAHPTRLFVVNELSRHGQRCVCELIGADMSAVSRHLAILRTESSATCHRHCGFGKMATHAKLGFVR